MRAIDQQAAVAPSAAPPQSEVALQLQALQHQQAISIDKLVNLTSERAAVAREVQNSAGEQQRIYVKSLADLDNAIANTQAAVAQTREQISALQGVRVVSPVAAPIALVPPTPRMFGLSREEFGGGAALVLLLPIALAAAWRVWRGGRRTTTAIEGDDVTRFSRLEQAVDAIAIEVERISESQRFSAKLLAERKPEPAYNQVPESQRVSS